MDIILATRNKDKAKQVLVLFEDSSVRVITLSDTKIQGEAAEDGKTLGENALKKAKYVYGRSRTWVMADDSGIFIHALGGAPGVHSKRWAGEGATTDEITAYTLKRMEGKTDRRATFKAVVAVVSPEGAHRCFGGNIAGLVLERPQGKPRPDMPYSRIFVPHGERRSFAEMSVEYENSISHRGQAFRQAREYLEKLGSKVAR